MPVRLLAKLKPVRGWLYLAILVPVWALGIVHGERMIDSLAPLPPFFGADLARFDRVRPRLDGSAGAFLLLDSAVRQTYGQRFFAAQYSLAPTVLSLTFDVDTVFAGAWDGQPRYVLCAFDEPERRARAEANLESAARRRGIAFSVEPVDDVLAVIRLGGEPRP